MSDRQADLVVTDCDVGHGRTRVRGTRVPVRDLREQDRAVWRTLWAGYLEFYEAEIADEVTDATWQRLIEGRGDVGALVAVDTHDLLIGFAHYVVHPTSWDSRPVGYLEDLFVHPDHRGRAVGRALIDRVVQLGQMRGWAEVYWITAADNEAARRLYRRVATETDWVRYEIPLDDDRPGDGG
jgi:ribosomal protein S18 acetylase RimI-like enzyme